MPATSGQSGCATSASIRPVIEHASGSPHGPKGKTREKIEDDRENLELSLELVTIDTNVPLDPGLDSVPGAEPDVPRLRTSFQDLDFRCLDDEISGYVEADAAGFSLLFHDDANAQLIIRVPR